MKTRHLRLLAAATGSARDAALSALTVGGNSTGHHGGGHGGILHISPATLGLTAAQYAFLFGTLSGASLPLGALLGLRLRPDDATCSGWIAVGAGALLFAVSVELYAHAIHDYTTGRMDPLAMVVLMTVSVLGSMFFTWTTRLLEGGYEEAPLEEEEEACPSCGQRAPGGAFFCHQCGRLLRLGRASLGGARVPLSAPAPLSARTDGSLSERGSDRRLSLSARSDRRLSCGSARSAALATPRGGREAVRTPDPPGARPVRSAPHGVGAMLRAARAQDRERARRRWKRLREAVTLMQVVRYLQDQAATTRLVTNARVSQTSPRSRSASAVAVAVSARSRSRRKQMTPRPRSWSASARRLSHTSQEAVEGWFERFKLAVSSTSAKDADLYTAVELQNMQQHRIGALKLYAVLLVDGIPEGILMGFLAAEGFLSTTLVISFLIANFPEAFAGAVLMQKGGFPRWQIVGVWGGLMLVIGMLAGVSCDLLLMVDPEFTGETHVPFEIQILVSVMEGLAGGAMISGIAGTMLPEAYERRNKTGWMVTSGGFLCTIGFLTSVGIKIAFG